jgi:long-chain acyl-CoA synthetase
MEHPDVTQAVVIGDRRKFLSAILAINPEKVAETGGGTDDFIDSVQAHVNVINERFARVEHVRKFRLLPRELDLDNSELTPTMKIKRRVVYENWADLIDTMYEEGA